MTSPDRRALVFVGPMGAGKTKLGRRVAKALDRSFIDTDDEVQRHHGAIAHIFATLGEGHFRSLERDAVARALERGDVVSLGGGAVLDADTRAQLRDHDVVFFTVSPEALAARIGAGTRPLLTGDDPIGRWQAIFAERLPLYREVADVEFDTSMRPTAEVVDDVVNWTRTRQSRAPHGGQEDI